MFKNSLSTVRPLALFVLLLSKCCYTTYEQGLGHSEFHLISLFVFQTVGIAVEFLFTHRASLRRQCAREPDRESEGGSLQHGQQREYHPFTPFPYSFRLSLFPALTQSFILSSLILIFIHSVTHCIINSFHLSFLHSCTVTLSIGIANLRLIIKSVAPSFIRKISRVPCCPLFV